MQGFSNCSVTALAAFGAFLATSGPSLTAEEPGKPRLEFRILADEKHDRAAAEKARETDGLAPPPTGYRWVHLGETISGANPKVEGTQLTVADAKWKVGELTGRVVNLSGLNL